MWKGWERVEGFGVEGERRGEERRGKGEGTTEGLV